MNNQVVHLTSAHSRYDTRIFLKMCVSLAGLGYDITLVVADGKGNEIKDGVKILDVGKNTGGRLSRMTKVVNLIYHCAKNMDADIVHMHDPELIPIGLKLKRMHTKIIFDAHEDLPKQLLSKPYLNKPIRYVLSIFFSIYEQFACGRFDSIVAATPFIQEKFQKFHGDVWNINNFPLSNELENDLGWQSKKNEVCYVGGITEIRGIKQLVEAFTYLKNVKLNLAGKFAEPLVESEVKQYPAWTQVNELGFLGRADVAEVMARSKVGLVTFHPYPNHIDAQPNKMFEYMSAGLPIITSNFPLWRDIVEGNNCGICVDPLEPKAIAAAIDYLISNPDKAEEMGKNGRKAVIEKYNWSIEEKKLHSLYQRLTK